MLSEGLSFLLLSVRPSTEAGLGVAAHMQSVSSCQGCCGEICSSMCDQKTFKGRAG
jgi:hypothetical protein